MKEVGAGRVIGPCLIAVADASGFESALGQMLFGIDLIMV